MTGIPRTLLSARVGAVMTRVLDVRSGFRTATSVASHADVVAGIAATAAALYLSFRFATEAGPLWRDEVSTINLASQPRFTDLLRLLSIDSMPALYPALLRLWQSVGWVEQDSALRFFGFLVALATVAAVWLSARALGVAVPILALTLFDLHGVVLQTAGSVKPYGVGAILLCLVFGGMWKVGSTPGSAALIWTSASAMLAVNTLYQNLPVIGAFCLAAAGARAGCRDWRGAGRVSIVGLATVASLVPYGSVIAASQDWRPLIRADNLVTDLAMRLANIFSDWSHPLLVVWAVAGAVALVGAFRAIRSGLQHDGGRLLYAVLVVIGAPVAFIAFFKAAARNVEPWHVASLIGVTALALDVVLVRTMTLRSVRFGLAVAAAAIVLPISWSWVGVRQTNVDLLATFVRATAQDGDAIIINPWFLGITFNRYYDGHVPWLTVPPIQDVRIHRYDLVKEQMKNADVMMPVYRRMQTALKTGHRVWLVGGAQFLPADQTPEILPPAPAAPTGWQHPPYYRAWSTGIGRFVETHARRLDVARIEVGQPVWKTEGAILMVADGWRGP